MTKSRIVLTVGSIILTLALVEAVLLIQLSGQRARYASYWKSRSSEKLTGGTEQVYIALGDSTGVGIGASRPENGYVGILAHKLGKDLNRPIRVINLSKTGARVSDVYQEQIPQLQKLDVPPDAIVTLATGANDINSFDADSFRIATDRLLSVMPAQSVVADVPYFGGGRSNSREQNALEASVIISELSAKYGLKLVRLHEATKQTNSLLNYAADWFHPNDRAYKIWARAFSDKLLERT